MQRARIETRRCPMHDEACAARVIEHITAKYPQPFDGAALVEKQCGRYVRGKHAGQLRGWATIEVCTVGGWRTDGPGQGNGHVVRPGTVCAIRIDDFNGRPYLTVS